jgi:pullulanase/glycogen debranching enzyme
VSSNGEQVQLCLFDDSGAETRLALPERDGDIWHGFAPGVEGRRYYTGKAASDLRWFTTSGAEMTAEEWSDPSARSVALFIDGSTDPDEGSDGTPMIDDDFFVLLNAW